MEGLMDQGMDEFMDRSVLQCLCCVVMWYRMGLDWIGLDCITLNLDCLTDWLIDCSID